MNPARPLRVGRHVVLPMVLAIAAAGQVQAATVHVTPSTLMQALDTAKGGDVLEFAPGDYGAVTVQKRSWEPMLVWDAKAARFSGLEFGAVRGVKISGGVVAAPSGDNTFGVKFNRSSNMAVTGMTISGAHAGVVIYASSDIEASYLTLVGLRSDGIDIGLSQRVLIDHNTCSGFTPIRAIYDAGGKMLQDGDHPDCVQGFSRPTAPVTADITVSNNTAEGDMQGFDFFNHARDGVDDGGFDRLRIISNTVHVSYTQGIAVYSARDSVIQGNRISSIAGSIIARNGRPIQTALRVIGGSNNKVCGNTVADYPKNPGSGPC